MLPHVLDHAGLCPGYWPKVPEALTHISLDSYTGDCFWEALATRGLYEQYLYPRMSPTQKVFLVPGIGPGDACDPKDPTCGELCTGFWNGTRCARPHRD